jgi:transcriptional regulator with XRE-family HTH domain
MIQLETRREEEQMKNISEWNGTFPQNMRRILEKKCVNQAALARKIGYESREICDILQGRRLVKVVDIQNISDGLDVPIEELLKK